MQVTRTLLISTQGLTLVPVRAIQASVALSLDKKGANVRQIAAIVRSFASHLQQFLVHASIFIWRRAPKLLLFRDMRFFTIGEGLDSTITYYGNLHHTYNLALLGHVVFAVWVTVWNCDFVAACLLQE